MAHVLAWEGFAQIGESAVKKDLQLSVAGSTIQATYVLAGDGLDNIIRRCPKEFGDDGELIYVCDPNGFKRQQVERLVRLFTRVRINLRSFPGNKGLPSNISAKIHPVLQISTGFAKEGGNSSVFIQDEIGFLAELTCYVVLLPSQHDLRSSVIPR